MPGMAHGFIESRIHGHRAIGHGGGTIHFFSDMQLIPDLGFGVFISTNTSGGGYALIRQFPHALVSRFFPEGPHSVRSLPTAEPARPLSAYAGTYLATRRPYTTVERLFMTSGAQVVALDDTLLAVSPIGAGEERLHPIGGDEFRSEQTGDLVKFVIDGNGSVTAMLIPMPIMVLEKVGLLESPRFLFGVLAVGALVMFCALVGASLRRPRPMPQTAAEAWAERAVLASSFVWLLVYVLGIVGLAPLLDDLGQAFFAFPSPWFVAALASALIAAVLTLLAAFMLYPVWSDRSWPIWRRLRHTGVVLAAMATLLVMRDLNAIGFHYLPD
jgi:hypothetical protein